MPGKASGRHNRRSLVPAHPTTDRLPLPIIGLAVTSEKVVRPQGPGVLPEFACPTVSDLPREPSRTRMPRYGDAGYRGDRPFHARVLVFARLPTSSSCSKVRKVAIPPDRALSVPRPITSSLWLDLAGVGQALDRLRRNGAGRLSSPGHSAIPRGTRKSPVCRPPLRCGLISCVVDRPRRHDRHRGRDGRGFETLTGDLSWLPSAPSKRPPTTSSSATS